MLTAEASVMSPAFCFCKVGWLQQNAEPIKSEPKVYNTIVYFKWIFSALRFDIDQPHQHTYPNIEIGVGGWGNCG